MTNLKKFAGFFFKMRYPWHSFFKWMNSERRSCEIFHVRAHDYFSHSPWMWLEGWNRSHRKVVWVALVSWEAGQPLYQDPYQIPPIYCNFRMCAHFFTSLPPLDNEIFMSEVQKVIVKLPTVLYFLSVTAAKRSSPWTFSNNVFNLKFSKLRNHFGASHFYCITGRILSNRVQTKMYDGL